MPFVVVFMALEAFITYTPNTFYLKSRNLKNNLPLVEALVLGSSHLQNAINPEYIDLNTVNLAYGGQDKQLDSLLFFNYIEQMPQLRFVLIEWDYLTFNKKVAPNYFRLPWYYRYHGLELYHLSFPEKASLYASSPPFFNNYIKQTLAANTYKYQITKHGFIANDFPGIFNDLNYDSIRIKKAEPNELKLINHNQTNLNYSFNNQKIASIVSFCKTRHIQVVFISSPVALLNSEFEIQAYRQELNAYLDNYLSMQNVHYLNFSNKERFILKDFKNFTHLNSEGAKKFSLLLNAELKNLNHSKFD